MKVFVTGVAGQLGHDVMNELAKRGYEGIGSDVKEVYSGVADGTPVTAMPYVPMDITDRAGDIHMATLLSTRNLKNTYRGPNTRLTAMPAPTTRTLT